MAKITYIEPGGTVHVVDLPADVSVMDGARRFAVAGIDGDCGGACACATCHVYVEGDGADRLPPMDDLERDMLDFAFDTRANSRLACQIKVGPETDGLVVRAPARQY